MAELEGPRAQGALAGGIAVAGSSVQGALSGATSAARLLQSRFSRRGAAAGEGGAAAAVEGGAALPPPDATALARVSTELQTVASGDNGDAAHSKGSGSGGSATSKADEDGGNGSHASLSMAGPAADLGGRTAVQADDGAQDGDGNLAPRLRHDSALAPGDVGGRPVAESAEDLEHDGSADCAVLLQLAADAEERFGAACCFNTTGDACAAEAAGTAADIDRAEKRTSSGVEQTPLSLWDASDPLQSEVDAQHGAAEAASSHHHSSGGSQCSHTSTDGRAIARTLERQSTGSHHGPLPGGLTVGISETRTAHAHGRAHAEYYVATGVAEGRHSGGWRRFSDVRALQKSLEAATTARGGHPGAALHHARALLALRSAR